MPTRRSHAARLLLVVATVLALAGVWTQAGHITGSPARARVDPEVASALERGETVRVIIKLRDPPALNAGDLAAARAQIADQQRRILRSVSHRELNVSYLYATVPAIAGTASTDAVEALSANPAVEAVELDAVGSAATNQSAPLIHAPEVHAAGITGAGVTIAVLDSGIDWDHVDLAADIAYERCYLTGQFCPGGGHPAADDNGHGTNVSGIMTSSGTASPKGIAPDVEIAAYKILGPAGTGIFSDWIRALDDIITNHPEVDFVNMSLQSTAACPSATMASAISTLRAAGVLTFIAAGNHGTKGSMTIPACLDEGISVGATYDTNLGAVNGWKAACTDATTFPDHVACWSDSSSALDLLAPGAAVSSTGHTGATSTYFGTSQASPHAAGVAALLLEARPELTADQIELRLEATGTLITDDLNDASPATNRTTPRVDARVALLVDGEDTDGDGCTDGEELGGVPVQGGARNPLDPYDFFDTNGDRSIDLFIDFFAVANAFGLSTGQAGYSPDLDRSEGPPDAEDWDMGPPDGNIDLFVDIFGVTYQFGHYCAAPLS